MKKRQIFLTLLLIIFSTYYTNKITDLLKMNDPIMQEIIQKENLYNEKALDAIITSNTMIPEKKGRKINRNKSFQKMKKLNTFQESLLIFDTIYPKISIQKHYDKIIISGNKQIKQVSLVLAVDDNNLFINLNQILKKNDVKANILTNKSFNLSNTSFVNILSYNYHNNIDYCLTNHLKIVKECTDNHKYTILGKEIKSYHLTQTKEQISNGVILVYFFDNDTFSNLNIIIKYLKNNYYKIVSIDELTYHQ